MATNDDLDPVKSQQRANDQLRVAMLQLDEHIQALTAPTMELALIQKKRASELGLEEREPSDLFRQFVSQAGTPGIGLPGGPREPGQLGPDSSTPDKAQMPQRSWGELGSPIAGKTNAEAQKIENEGIRIPQFGEWQVDTLLREAAGIAGRKAMKQYGNYASNARANQEEPMSAEAWQQSQTGTFASTNVAQAFESGASRVAEASLIHKKILQPMLDIGFGAANSGAALGFSPQAGTGLNASHILGIPNPIAAFTSPAGRQGLGTMINAAEASFGGTGIGYGEAAGLRSALAQEGWSNQRSGGALGMTVGGQQENLALGMEPLVKMGFKNPDVLAGFSNALKLGTGNIGELTKGIETLAETSKTTHHTLEQEAEKAQEFMAKAVEGGTSMMHGLQAYGEIAKLTGISPLQTQQANEGTFGRVQAAQKGVLPWQIASMTAGQASTNAYAAVKQLSEIAGPGKAVKTTNKYGETEEVSAKAAQLAMMHQLEPNMTTEYMEHMLKVGPHLEAAASAANKAKGLEAFISQKRHENEAYGPHVHAAFQAEHEYQKEASWQKQVEANLKKNPGDAAEEWNLETAKKNTQAKLQAMQAAKKAAAGEGHLTGQQESNVIDQLAGKGGLYERAREAGLEQHGELKQWMHEAPEKQIQNIQAALAKVNATEPEANEKAKAEIVLNSNAEKWFKLQFPNAKSPKSEANAGGKSTASSAAQPSTGETAQNAALAKSVPQIIRNEPTSGG